MAMIEESIAPQNQKFVMEHEEATRAEDRGGFHELVDGLKDDATRIAAETASWMLPPELLQRQAQSEADRREAGTNRLFKLTEDELNSHKEPVKEDVTKSKALE